MTPPHEVTIGQALLIDVRRKDEWDEGHAEHAVHIPLDTLLSGGEQRLTQNKKIYVYCQAGGRAGRAAQYLQTQGSDVVNAGGLRDWIASGGTLAR